MARLCGLGCDAAILSRFPGDEAGYEELSDVGVVQAQKRDGSKRGSAKKSSKKGGGQCKQQ